MSLLLERQSWSTPYMGYFCKATIHAFVLSVICLLCSKNWIQTLGLAFSASPLSKPAWCHSVGLLFSIVHLTIIHSVPSLCVFYHKSLYTPDSVHFSSLICGAAKSLLTVCWLLDCSVCWKVVLFIYAEWICVKRGTFTAWRLLFGLLYYLLSINTCCLFVYR